MVTLRVRLTRRPAVTFLGDRHQSLRRSRAPRLPAALEGLPVGRSVELDLSGLAGRAGRRVAFANRRRS